MVCFTAELVVVNDTVPCSSPLSFIVLLSGPSDQSCEGTETLSGSIVGWGSVCPVLCWLMFHPEKGLPSLWGVGGAAGSDSSQIQAISHHPICCSQLPQFCQDCLTPSVLFPPIHRLSR